jgi:hypothetical protein
MEDLAILSRELGSVIDRVHAEIDASQLDTLAARLKSIEANFISRVGNDPTLILETKRRIAEANFLVAIRKNGPFELCEKLFREIRQLGFSNHYTELSFHIILARRCLQSGRLTEGIHLLEPFENEGKRDNLGSAARRSKEDTRLIKNLINKLRKKSI